ncbi:MAG: transposase [Acidobacteriota bacterium]|nr:transposase [Acidobacteriota bacterium]
MQNSSINPREIRGREIARKYALTEQNGVWFVPSASGKSTRYKVDLTKQKCTCPDFEIRRVKCKHLFAAECSFEQDFLGELSKQEISQLPKPTPTRKTYRQNWTAYNTAQTSEKAEFQRLLATLCKSIGEPSQTNGRPRLPLADMIFSCAYKVFSTFSGRRFSTDLQDAKGKGFISDVPHFNSVLRYFDKPLLTPYLQMLIEESSLPLSALEKTFAIDASGLSATHGFTWHYAKYEQPRLIAKKDWLKVHICTGTLTNVVTAVEVTDKYEHDTNYFEPLLLATKQNFNVSEISADKAYLSKVNLQTAVDNNSYPFIAWKSNSKITEKEGNELWNKLFHYFSLNKEKFLERYHQRSNSESAFSMIKAKFSDRLRSKNRTAQKNEALCKILCHNLCCLIQSIYEFGLKPEFWKEI